jgi:PQQ enzyme repeat
MSKLWQYDVNPYTGGGSTSPDPINMTNGVLVPNLPIPLLGENGYLPTGLTTYIPKGSTITVNANIPINSTTIGGSLSGHGTTTYDWNISLPIVNTMPPPYPSISATTGQLVQPPPGTNPVTILAAKAGDVILCRNGTLPTGFGATKPGYPQLPYTYFAINLNASKGAVGSILWMKTYNPPAGNITLLQSAVDFDSRVFIINELETVRFEGYSLDSGAPLWVTDPEIAWNYYADPGQPVTGTTAYGNFYADGFGGILYCYDAVTGNLKWTYGNGGAGNSTYAGLNVFYGEYPTQIQSIANGVVYTATDEHTIPNPMYKGALATAINATDGTELWTLSLYPSEWQASAAPQWATADGYIVAMNGLDNNIYSIGRGPSAITATAQSFGTSVVIRGTVTDTSAGTKQSQQVADFPNGVPVASDASMKDWMGYVYQQKPLPTNFTGVPVTIEVIDSNGNQRTIGSATTDNTGLYSLTWTPDIPGDFKVIATFEGTNGYWPASTETTFTAEQPHPTAVPTAAPVASMTDTYVLSTGIAIIIILVIIGAAILLTLRKRA